MNNGSKGRLLSVRQVAARLSLSENTIRAWIFQKKIEFYKIGRSVKIDSQEIDRVLERGRREATGREPQPETELRSSSGAINQAVNPEAN